MSVSDFTETFADWLTSTVSVEKHVAAAFDGQSYAAAQPLEGVMIDEHRRLIRNSDGNEIVSETTLYVPLELADKINLHARVELPDGRRTKVARIASPDVYGIFGFRVVSLE